MGSIRQDITLPFFLASFAGISLCNLHQVPEGYCHMLVCRQFTFPSKDIL